MCLVVLSLAVVVGWGVVVEVVAVGVGAGVCLVVLIFTVVVVCGVAVDVVARDV